MTRSHLLICAAVLTISTRAHAELELKNDGFVSGSAATFQNGFIAGEAGGSRFLAPSAGRQLLKVQLLFGGAATMTNFTIKVFDDTAGTDAPGAELFMADFQLTGSDSAMQELDLTSANVLVPAQFRVAFVFQTPAPPSIASDADGISADKNFILTAAGWKKSSALGVPGDWVIRAFVSDAGSPDAGVNVFCDVNTECPGGQYCDAPHHACTYDCRSNSDCPNSGTCDSLGQCAPGGGDGGGCAASGGGATGAMLGLGGLLAILLTRRARR